MPGQATTILTESHVGRFLQNYVDRAVGEKPSLVVATVLRAPKSTLNASDGSLAPLRVPHGRENLKPPQVLARVAIGTMPVGELEYGRRVDARGGRARVGLDSERGPRVLGLESARGAGR